MISGSLLASFGHHCSCFPMTEFWIIFGWYLLRFFIDLDSRKGSRVCVFWHTFLIFVRPWSARVSLKVPWLVLALLLAPVWLLWNLFGSFLAPFGYRKPSTDRERERERVREREIYFATISAYILVFAPWHLWRAAEGRLDAAVLLQFATTRIHALRL